MTRRHLMTLRLVVILADFLAAVITFLAASAARFRESDPTAVWSVGIDIGVASLLFATVWVTVLWTMGLYHLRARWSMAAELRDVARATLSVIAVTLAALFILHQDNVSRLFLLSLFVAQPAISVGLRLLLRLWFERLRSRGHNLTYMVIAGTGSLAQEFADEVESHPGLGLRVVGHLTVPPYGRRATERSELVASAPAIGVTRPVLGTIDQLPAVFRSHVVDEVGICLPAEVGHFLEPLIAIAADEGKTVRVPRDPEEGALRGALHEDFGTFLVRSVVHDGHRELERALKRLIDVVGASIAIVVLSPVLLAVAIAIRMRDGSPVIFRQTRIGLHGRPFTILKFRTMCGDAEDRYAELAAMSDTRGAAFKMADDPRVTPMGRVLRKWTLDELPQLVNVLVGDMSLVGPRPAPPREVAEYDIWHRRRLPVRPGMTGLWQVEARFDDHFDDRAELDLRYIDHWSLWMDLGILLKTVPAVLSPRGR